MKAALILSLICWLVPPKHQTYNDETEADATERYATIAAAVHEVAGENKRLVRFLLTVGRHETHFKRRYHDGSALGDNGHSWGTFQKYLSPAHDRDAKIRGTPYTASDIVGTDIASTRRAVEVAAGDLSGCIRRCGGQPMCVFKQYGGVSGKPSAEVQKRLEARVATYMHLRKR